MGKEKSNTEVLQCTYKYELFIGANKKKHRDDIDLSKTRGQGCPFQSICS
jgi:hypothetical protein